MGKDRAAMPAFMRVDHDRAGPTALGILVPPGQSTLVILRPRPLAWDLLPARWDGEPARPPVLCRFERDEAARIARRLQRHLEEQVANGTSPVRTVGDGAGLHFQVWVAMQELVWILCQRAPGVAYKALVFPTLDDATAAAHLVEAIVWPGAPGQEYYFNTQKFTY